MRARYVEAVRRLAVGDLEGLDEWLAALVAQTAGGEARDALRSLRVRLATIEGRVPDAGDVSGLEGGTVLDLALAQNRIHRGERVPIEAPADPELSVVARTIAAQSALVRGDLATARALVEDSVRGARGLGLALCEWEALQTSCDIATASRSKGAVALARRLSSIGSPRFVREARFYLEHDEPASLEDLASTPEIAPVAARRARLLLGGMPLLDAVDRPVLEALRDPRIEDVFVPPGPWIPGWGLDAPRRRVWLPDGRTVDLRKAPSLWRLLAFLVEHGAATTESLAAIVPAASLASSIRDLRERIEDDPTSPTRILSDEDGYSITGPLRRRT